MTKKKDDINNAYNIGAFSKIAKVTERTLRYYDKLGLLVPKLNPDNGYRMYTNYDLMKLQQILIFKSFGFSLEEIKMLILSNDEQNVIESLSLQRDLVEKKIQYYNKLFSALTYIIEQGYNDTTHLVDILDILSKDDTIVEQYKDSRNLSIRIALHRNFSVSKVNWFSWLFNKVDFSVVNILLELGCGNGELWQNTNVNLQNKEIFLTDISEGMLTDAKKNLGDGFNYFVVDAQNIPFRREYFDCIIANHVLFYLKDIHEGLSEVNRVLKNKGFFYCTTYSQFHMYEITKLVQEYNKNIVLSYEPLFDRFGMENGKKILEKYFSLVTIEEFNDYLMVNDAKPLVDYIMSCHGNQSELLKNSYEEFYEFVKEKITKDGPIRITKQACLFTCIK